MRFLNYLLLVLAVISCSEKKAENSAQPLPSNLFEYTDQADTRWSSYENITAEKGKGGMENNGAKGHPSDQIAAGETVTLLNTEGPGIINRIWITIADRSPEMLRSLKIEMFWDGETKPAVTVPFGDFFGVGLGRTAQYENALFANPEGRSFNSFVQMPFKKSARIQITNESEKDLSAIFFDVNFQKLNNWDSDFLYFHCYWSRDTATALGKDFVLLPTVKGNGRFLGTNVGVNANPVYRDFWFGEGEVKIYLNNDQEYPTLVGTGTEDYIGTAWGQGEFVLDYTGCPIANEDFQWAFYRYHIPDPVFFKTDCKVALQQIGGAPKESVQEVINEGAGLIPITIQTEDSLLHLYNPEADPVDLNDPAYPNMWTNFYRSDDVSATAYFYLNKPSNELPALQPVALRTANL